MKGDYMANKEVKKVETAVFDTEKVGGFLAAMMIGAFIAGIGSLVVFFVSLASLAEGTNSGNEAVFFSSFMVGGILCSAGFIATGILINFRKKIAKIFAWASLGIYFLMNAIAMIALMTYTYTLSRYDYDCLECGISGVGYKPTGLPVGVVIALAGCIFVAALQSGLIALYFIISKRAKATLVK